MSKHDSRAQYSPITQFDLDHDNSPIKITQAADATSKLLGRPLQPNFPNSKTLTIINIVILIASLGFVTVGLRFQCPGRSGVLEKITHSPFIPNRLRAEFGPKYFSTMPLSSSESKFRRKPDQVVEAAWEHITDIGVLALTADEIRALGKDPASVVKAPLDWVDGKDRFLAHIDGIHLLHCLDAMRKSLWFNFERFHPNGVPIVFRTHLAHCQEALTNWLMCHPSLELLPYTWVVGRSNPFPDFDVTRKCISYDALLEWQDETRIRDLTDEKWLTLIKPEDATSLPTPILLFEAYNVSRLEDLESAMIRLGEEWGPRMDKNAKS